MRTIRFHKYGEPKDVLHMEEATIPSPGPGRIRAIVHACGVNPADWALCRGLFPGSLPRGIGLEISGVVDAVGEGISDIAIGDRVLGTADFAGAPSAGAADHAIMDHWCTMPAGLDFVKAAALPMAVATATAHLDALAMQAGQTLLVHGGGTTVGYAAVQLATMRGQRVITTAGQTYAEPLRATGALVTPYGDGMVERVRALGNVDFVLDTAPPSGVLPSLVAIAEGDPGRVLTITDFTAAAPLGVRTTFGETTIKLRYDVLAEIAQLTADGKFTIPVAKTFPLEAWRAALDISLSGHARGKLVLLPI